MINPRRIIVKPSAVSDGVKLFWVLYPDFMLLLIFHDKSLTSSSRPGTCVASGASH
jgi:hypothetical protein